jgi:hypothetical protein
MIKLAKREALIPLFSAICRLGVGNASTKLFLMTCGSPKLEPVLRQNLVTIDIVDFLQPSATLYWYEVITILAVLLFQSITQRSMQFGS